MRKSRLSWHKQSRLIELFVARTTARTAAQWVGVNKTTASYYFHRLRQPIYAHSEHLEWLEGEVEADERYWGGRRKGKRGRGALGKVPVLGLLKRHGKVFTVLIPNAKADTLLPNIGQKVRPDSMAYTDTFGRYNALDVSEFKHYRINPSERFADQQNPINGIENVWNQAKRHWRRFNGVAREHFHLFLKECEWRFDNSDPSLVHDDLSPVPALVFKGFRSLPACWRIPDVARGQGKGHCRCGICRSHMNFRRPPGAGLTHRLWTIFLTRRSHRGEL